MFHLGKVRKLDTRRVLRDIANERDDEWLPESWNNTKTSPSKYWKNLNRAWNAARDVSVIKNEGFPFLISYFHFVVAPILHNSPWEAEYFMPVLNKAYEFLYTKVEAGWHQGYYDYDQKYTMLQPIIEAFAESGVYTPTPHPSDYVHHVNDWYSFHTIEKMVDFREKYKADIRNRYKRAMNSIENVEDLERVIKLAHARMGCKPVGKPGVYSHKWAVHVVEAANLLGHRIY